MYRVEELLQAEGIPASAVQNSPELALDPQLAHRGHFVALDDPRARVEGSRFHLSRTPAKVGGPIPTFGRDNHYVLETLLGYDPERIAELVIAGVLD